MSDPEAVRRYLDNAATSWPKPPEVFAAWEHAGRSIGATAGRATYREAVAADAIRSRCRAAVARLLGDVDPQRVAFPSGATLGLNMAIHGLLASGDHVIATAADHNATLRPLHWLESRGVITLSIVPCDGARPCRSGSGRPGLATGDAARGLLARLQCHRCCSGCPGLWHDHT